MDNNLEETEPDVSACVCVFETEGVASGGKSERDGV